MKGGEPCNTISSGSDVLVRGAVSSKPSRNSATPVNTRTSLLVISTRHKMQNNEHTRHGSRRNSLELALAEQHDLTIEELGFYTLAELEMLAETVDA